MAARALRRARDLPTIAPDRTVDGHGMREGLQTLSGREKETLGFSWAGTMRNP
jgi:hypothetical protein